MSARDERTERIADACTQLGVDAIMLSAVDGVAHAVGYGGAPELGPSPHAGGPNVAIVTRAGVSGLVVPDLEGADARASRADVVRTYETFAPRPHAAPLHELLVSAIGALVGELGLDGAAVAVDSRLPLVVRDGLDGRLHGWADAQPALVRARATKTAAEVAQLRRCAELTGVGQRRAREAAVPGISELELLGEIRTAIELAAGTTFALGVDLLSGVARSVQAIGGPSRRLLAEGDPLLCDLGPRVDGYWGDSCTSFAVGAPTTAYAALHGAVLRALERAAEEMRPRISAGALDAAVRAELARAGHLDPLHTGHGIGTANFELPRIVPGEPLPLEPGMVLMMEPGAYVPGIGGVRLEWMFLVTESGNELLSPYDCRL